MWRYRIAVSVALIAATSAFAPGRHVSRIKQIRSTAALHATKLEIGDDEPCVVGENVVQSCATDQSTSTAGGTQTKLSAATNLGKCICGAGSFALPHVFLDEGVLGGTLAMTTCGLLAAITMQSINRSRYTVSRIENVEPPTSYVALTELALGGSISKVVFALTLAASLGVCSTYIVFVGQTLASLSADEVSNNIVHSIAPNVDERTWEIITAGTVYPLSLIRNYGVFAFTSALGVTAVLGGIATTLVYGVFVDPGLGIFEALSAVTELKMWPDSIADAFGGSFGTIAYLFCVNFLTFPIINSMKNAEEEYSGAVSSAVAVIWVVNIVFALICLSFYGESTQDLVLQNLDNGPYLSALKILLCIDLLFTFPVVFSSGRQILENSILGETNNNLLDTNGVVEIDEENELSIALSRAAITAGAVGTCFGLSQLGGFGTVANLVGGLAQGTLAFIVPPAIEISLSRRSGENSVAKEIPQWAVGSFGVAVVAAVTFFTLKESIS
mmetsp:Transcript_4732/g.9900  ORF Transcript_4732/g.9900 Transcript_4732/m.9900 type:complete len:500 (+) Transcript_4732:51-1550(+)|eukprot:CAMPEP_0113383344 /NCGR_PEP_ID=MMETSP0013_2-20120614/6308_1 /TAXON_ID=2843 ORGANISM="Skeletonema costatum, Strain 1716" /NCGR_SAMPLE_ID=MMETSP0013_2 /ASSEMBLY_ACC=CAM_ASM_000158 /LENGTH=499 /DNA_ID=CAMNT_0000265877 /DNA_START=51 /DNA_END=1550 /DNA_ORIENTATION=- /assembly_acc=CAM_ASM_000158